MFEDEAAEMSSEGAQTNPPDTQASPPRRSGCRRVLRVFVGLAVLFLAFLVCVYLVLMHTSWPLRQMAATIEKQGGAVNLRITGVSGSLSSGVRIQSMSWNDGEIGDVRFTYNGIVDVLWNKRLIIREVHIGRAHLNIVDGKETASAPASSETTETANGSGEWPLKLFQIDRVTLLDLVFKNRATGFGMSIPSIEWSGFKAEEPGKVELGQLSAETDRFKIATRKSPSAEFQKRVEGTLMPKLHEKIRRPINFVVDVGFADNNMTCRASVFDNQVDLEIKPDRTGHLRCRGLDLADYFDVALPQDLTIDAVLPAATDTASHPLDIRSGSFKLGIRTFEIQPMIWDQTAVQAESNVPRAISRESGLEIVYELSIEGAAEQQSVRQRLTAKPPLDLRDTVAHVFYGKNFADLGPAEQDDVDKKRASFASP